MHLIKQVDMSALGQLICRGVLTLRRHPIRAEHPIPQAIPRVIPAALFTPADQAILAARLIPKVHPCLNRIPVVGRLGANLKQATTELKTIQPINGSAVDRVVSGAS